MSQMFYAVLAGERGKKASANARLAEENYEAAKSWEDTAKQWQQSAHQWKEHSLALRSRIVEWQQSAIESEAISRAKTTIVKSRFNEDTSSYLATDEGRLLIEQKQQEVIKEWGVDPWAKN